MFHPGEYLGDYLVSSYNDKKIAFKFPRKKYLKMFLISLGLAIVFGLSISDIFFGHEEMLDYLLVSSLIPFVLIMGIVCIIYAATPTGFEVDATKNQMIFKYLGRKKVIKFNEVDRVEKDVVDRFVTNGTASTTIDFTVRVLLKNSRKLHLYVKTDSYSQAADKNEICEKWNPILDTLVKDVSGLVKR